MVRRSRRTALRTLGAAFAGFGGCQSRGSDAGSTTTIAPEAHDAVRWHARVGPVLESAPTVHDGAVYVNGGSLVALDAADGTRQWTYSTRVDWDASHSRPMVADGRVYAALGVEGGGVAVVAVRESDGGREWRFEPSEFDGPVLSAGATTDAVYVGSAGGTEAGEDLYAVGADGEKRWHRDLAGTCDGGAAVAGDVVVLGTGDGLFALDPASGETRWRVDHASPGCPPVVRSETVYVGGSSGVVALDARDGSVQWELDGDLPGADEWTLADGRVYAAGGGVAYALDAGTGEVTWRASLPSGRLRAVAAPGDGRAYVGADWGVSTFDAETGKRAWRVEWDADHLAVARNTAFVTADGWRSLAALDAADGTRQWRVGFDEPMVAPPVVDGGTAYVGTDDRVAYALDA